MKRLLILLQILSNAIAGRGAGAWSSQLERDVIAAVLMAEARGEGMTGMNAVAQVIRNRGGNPFDTVIKHHAFSCLNGKTSYRLVDEMSKEKGWAIAQEIAWVLKQNPKLLGNSVKGATYYERKGTRAFWTK